MLEKRCKILWFTVVYLNFAAINAYAYVDGSECQRQTKQMLRTDLDCIIQFGPDSNEKTKLINQTQGVISDFICAMPLIFEKSQIYNTWIKPGLIKLPSLNITCTLFGINNEPLEVSSAFQPMCEKKSNIWSCDLNMSKTQGLGILGRILENYINKEPSLKKEMGEALEGLEMQ